MRASPREGDLFLFAVGNYYIIDEFSAVIGINPQDRKWEQRLHSLEGRQDRLLAPMQEGEAFVPSRGHIGERQGVQVPALNVCATVGAPGLLEVKPGWVTALTNSTCHRSLARHERYLRKHTRGTYGSRTRANSRDLVQRAKIAGFIP